MLSRWQRGPGSTSHGPSEAGDAGQTSPPGPRAPGRTPFPGLVPRRVPATAYRGEVITCSFCGAAVEADTAPVTWTSAVENEKQQWYCDDCSRTHLRAMEGKLDSEWW